MIRYHLHTGFDIRQGSRLAAARDLAGQALLMNGQGVMDGWIWAVGVEEAPSSMAPWTGFGRLEANAALRWQHVRGRCRAREMGDCMAEAGAGAGFSPFTGWLNHCCPAPDFAAQRKRIKAQPRRNQTPGSSPSRIEVHERRGADPALSVCVCAPAAHCHHPPRPGSAGWAAGVLTVSESIGC